MVDHHRRDRLLAEIHPALMRMAGRYRQKAGLPWQWRDDHCHELVIEAMDAYDQYSHLPDDQLRRIMIRAARNDHIDIIRRSAARAPLDAYVTDHLDVIAANQEVDAVDAADWFAVTARRVGLTRQEVAAILAIVKGEAVQEMAITMGVSCRTAHRRLASARRKLHVAVSEIQAGFRYMVSSPRHGRAS